MANITNPLANIYKTSFLIRQTFVKYTNTLAMNQIIQMTHRHETAPVSTPIKQQVHIRQLHRKLALPTAEGTYYVRWNDISYCVAESNYCRVHRNTGRPILVAKTLKSIAGQLPQNAFVRTHQSYMVRLEMIAFSNREELTLEDGTQIPISRNRRAELMKRLLTITLA